MGAEAPEWLASARSTANRRAGSLAVAIVGLGTAAATRIVLGSLTLSFAIAVGAGVAFGLVLALRMLENLVDTRAELGPNAYVVQVYAAGGEALAGHWHVLVIRRTTVHLVLPPWRGESDHALALRTVDVRPARFGRRWMRLVGADATVMVVRGRQRCVAALEACISSSAAEDHPPA